MKIENGLAWDDTIAMLTFYLSDQICIDLNCLESLISKHSSHRTFKIWIINSNIVSKYSKFHFLFFNMKLIIRKADACVHKIDIKFISYRHWNHHSIYINPLKQSMPFNYLLPYRSFKSSSTSTMSSFGFDGYTSFEFFQACTIQFPFKVFFFSFRSFFFFFLFFRNWNPISIIFLSIHIEMKRQRAKSGVWMC